MNRHERRANKSLDGIVRAPDGRRMAVIRPSNPTEALRLAALAVETQDQALLADLPNRVECDYRFIGWFSRGPRIVNDAGEVIGKIEPGDSFVTFENDDPTTAIVKKEQPS